MLSATGAGSYEASSDLGRGILPVAAPDGFGFQGVRFSLNLKLQTTVNLNLRDSASAFGPAHWRHKQRLDWTQGGIESAAMLTFSYKNRGLFGSRAWASLPRTVPVILT